MSSSILTYFKKTDRSCLPCPQGPLAKSIPSSAIAAGNREIRQLLDKKKTRGKYNKYSSSDRAVLGKFAAENGTQACVRKFKDYFINESTIREFKKSYQEALAKKRRLGDSSEVKKIEIKKQGRPVILGKILDDTVQKYILSIRESGGVVNTPIVRAGARGIIMNIDRTMLSEYGGPASLNRGWANSILKRMKFTRRAGTTQDKITPHDFEIQRVNFLQEIIDIVTMENIPPQLIINWDQTGIYIVPSSNWTMARKGKRRVSIRGLKDKRMITGVFCCSMVGDFLPLQLIYSGKTDRCHPLTTFPSDWDITHNVKHWSNETTMIRYINNTIVPFIASTRELMGLDKHQASLAIFDCFKGQVTNAVVDILEEHNIHSVTIPANCTDRLQPLDLTVNKIAKVFLQKEFQKWYATEISTRFNATTRTMDELVDLSMSRMKNIGATWLIRLYQHLCDNPSNIVNGFLSAQIQQSIDAGKPVSNTGNSAIPVTNCSDDDVSDDDVSDDDDMSLCDDRNYDEDTSDDRDVVQD